MISAKLDRKITLRQPSTSTNSYGEEEVTYSDYDTVFANVRQQGAREMFGAGKISEVDVVFTIRYLSAIDETWNIVWDSTTYEITGKPKELGRRDGLEIPARSQSS